MPESVPANDAVCAPNRMLAFDRGFLHNSMAIANPMAGDALFEMTPEGFHESFANTMSRAESDLAYAATATHDSRNVLRDCMLGPGEIDLRRPHVPLLFIAAAEDQNCPPALNQKNADAYAHQGSITHYHEFPNRAHFICGEPGWEEVAGYVSEWIAAQRSLAIAA